jgi:hypothetical protein
LASCSFYDRSLHLWQCYLWAEIWRNMFEMQPNPGRKWSNLYQWYVYMELLNDCIHDGWTNILFCSWTSILWYKLSKFSVPLCYKLSKFKVQCTRVYWVSSKPWSPLSHC